MTASTTTCPVLWALLICRKLVADRMMSFRWSTVGMGQAMQRIPGSMDMGEDDIRTEQFAPY